MSHKQKEWLVEGIEAPEQRCHKGCHTQESPDFVGTPNFIAAKMDGAECRFIGMMTVGRIEGW